jgi:hypothetical protein
MMGAAAAISRTRESLSRVDFDGKGKRVPNNKREPLMEKGKTETAYTIRRCYLSFQYMYLRMVLTTYNTLQQMQW